jgi:hypothetical protein
MTEDTPELLRLRGENDTMRALLCKIMPCHYCGAAEMVRCPYGFPGCGLMDDIQNGEISYAAELRRTRKALGKLIHVIERHEGEDGPQSCAEAIAILQEVPDQPRTDDELRALWRANGGEFHGPHVEHGSIEEQALFKLLRKLLGEPRF